jgi:uncharacterized HhH-GPD family protein
VSQQLDGASPVWALQDRPPPANVTWGTPLRMRETFAVLHTAGPIPRGRHPAALPSRSTAGPLPFRTMSATFPISGEPEADALLAEEPLALVLGMMLDQQVPMEWAFASPYKLKERLGGQLDAAHIAHLPLEELEEAFKGPPALHRYPGSMAKRAQALCQYLVDTYDGDPTGVWSGVESGRELVKRVEALPGYGKEKARIFSALLAKRLDVTPPGWEEATSPFSDDQPRSVADIDSAEALQKVRAWKKQMKAAGKGKAD